MVSRYSPTDIFRIICNIKLTIKFRYVKKRTTGKSTKPQCGAVKQHAYQRIKIMNFMNMTSCSLVDYTQRSRAKVTGDPSVSIFKVEDDIYHREILKSLIIYV